MTKAITNKCELSAQSATRDESGALRAGRDRSESQCPARSAGSRASSALRPSTTIRFGLEFGRDLVTARVSKRSDQHSLLQGRIGQRPSVSTGTVDSRRTTRRYAPRPFRDLRRAPPSRSTSCVTTHRVLCASSSAVGRARSNRQRRLGACDDQSGATVPFAHAYAPSRTLPRSAPMMPARSCRRDRSSRA